MASKMTLFGRKTAGAGKKKDILFCVFSMFHVCFISQAIANGELAGRANLQKNHT
jgi:hypothetical protein